MVKLGVINSMTDKEIATAILHRDPIITREFLYKKCFPLFNSIYKKYYTDCGSCLEFINEIYLYIVTPNKTTGKSKLADFGFRCTLTLWLKIVAENYCRQLFAKITDIFEEKIDASDRFERLGPSLEIDFQEINMQDVQNILTLMPNQRYRALIEYRYVDERSNEETAELLHMTMANYYNKHKLAKAQFIAALRKEGLA